MIGLGLGISKSRAIGSAVEVPPVFQGLNAADPVNEVDGTANTDGNGQMIVTSQNSPAAHSGSHFLRFEQNAGENTLADAYISLMGVLSGQNITVTFYVNQLIGLAWTTRLVSGDWTGTVSANPDDGLTGWQQLQLTGTAQVNNPRLNIRGTSASDTGNQIGVDSISIVIN